MQKLSLGIALLLVFVSMVGGGGAEGVPTPITLSTLTVEAARAPQRVGTTQQLTAIATFSDHTTRDVTSCATWTSDAPQIARVTESGGRETALGAGDATVFASFRAYGKTATASLSLRVMPATAWPNTVESAILQRELFMTAQNGGNSRARSRKHARVIETSHTSVRPAISVAETRVTTLCAASTNTAQPHRAGIDGRK